MDNEKMIESIRTLCKNRNITPTKLEEELGFSQGLISRWKDKNPNIDRIIDIANYFHVSLDEVVGFDIYQTVRDDFLNLLMENTQNSNIEWHSLSKTFIEEVQTYDLVHDRYNKYNSSKFEQSTFYTKYQNGYIIIYSVYSKETCYNPNEIFLAIQPQENECKLINQSYDKNVLFSLYLKVLTSLQNEAPDEVKAEAFKASFINEFKKKDTDNKKFRNAQLSSNDFGEANLSFSNFTKADLRGADFNGADLSGANFKGAILKGSQLENIILSEEYKIVKTEE